MSHIVSRLLPQERIARQVVGLIGEDMRRTGVDPGVVEGLANPNNEQHVDAQKERLLRHPSRYLGALTTKQLLGGQLGLRNPRLVGLVKYNEHRAADQLPYATNEAEQIELQAAIDANRHHLPGRPLGIFALTVSGVLAPYRQIEVAGSLIEAVVRRADEVVREIRIGVAKNDALLPALEQHGFVSTKIQEAHNGTPHTLYVRDPQPQPS